VYLLNNTSEKTIEDAIGETIENEVKPQLLDIESFAEKYKILGLIIAFNHYKVGVYTKYYYYGEKSYLAKKSAFDPGHLIELLILSKHTEVIQGIYKSKGLIKTFKMKDGMGRDTLGYVLIEASNRAPVRKLKKIMEKLSQKIESVLMNEKQIDPETLKKRIEKMLADM